MPNHIKKRPTTFAVIGLGFISDKHIAAIHNVGGEIIAGCDIDESKAHKIGKAEFFTNWRDIFTNPLTKHVDYVSICTPNYLHYPMAMMAAEHRKKVILEKPAVISYADLYNLKKYEHLISNIVQLRYNDKLIELKRGLDLGDKQKKHMAEFAVFVHRDDWYMKSWKNDDYFSGGLMFNIGVHYFDLLCWLFGKPINKELLRKDKKICGGRLHFNNCIAEWGLSIDQPIDNQFRYLKIDGETINLTQNFDGLHTRIYQETLKGNFIKLSDIEEAIKLLCEYDT